MGSYKPPVPSFFGRRHRERRYAVRWQLDRGICGLDDGPAELGALVCARRAVLAADFPGLFLRLKRYDLLLGARPFLPVHPLISPITSCRIDRIEGDFRKLREKTAATPTARLGTLKE